MPSAIAAMDRVTSQGVALSTNIQHDTPQDEEDEEKEIQDIDLSQDATLELLYHHSSDKDRHTEEFANPLSTNAFDERGSSILYPLRSEMTSPGRPTQHRRHQDNASWAMEHSNDQGASILNALRPGATTPARPSCESRRLENITWANESTGDPFIGDICGATTSITPTRPRRRRNNGKWAKRNAPSRDPTTTTHHGLEGQAMSSTDGLPSFSCLHADGFASCPPSLYGNHAEEAALDWSSDRILSSWPHSRKDDMTGKDADNHMDIRRLRIDRKMENGLFSSALPQFEAACLPLELAWSHQGSSLSSMPRLSTLSPTTSIPQSASGTHTSPSHCASSSAQMQSHASIESMDKCPCPTSRDNHNWIDASQEAFLSSWIGFSFS